HLVEVLDEPKGEIVFHVSDGGIVRHGLLQTYVCLSESGEDSFQLVSVPPSDAKRRAEPDTRNDSGHGTPKLSTLPRGKLGRLSPRVRVTPPCHTMPIRRSAPSSREPPHATTGPTIRRVRRRPPFRGPSSGRRPRGEATLHRLVRDRRRRSRRRCL